MFLIAGIIVLIILLLIACIVAVDADDIEGEEEPRHLSYPRRRALRKQARKASAQRFGDRTK